MGTANINLPSLTVLIPTLNEEGFIDGCLSSIINGSYASEKLEIFVIDGGSTDRTVDIVDSIIESNPCIKVLHNSKKTVPTAMNLGIQNASHDHIVWLGAHALYDRDYLLNSISILLDEKCASVGGVITPIGKTWMGRAIAAATSSKFGIGNARYRHAKKREFVDTVFGGCWRKADIVNIGGFNEKWVRNQDYELNVRLRKNVGQIILDPCIHCQYFCRESLITLAKQYFQYGFWRFQTSIKHPKTFTIRQAAPILLFCGLILSLCIAPFTLLTALILPTIYISATILASVAISLHRKRISLLPALPIVLATLHLSWAAGFMRRGFNHLTKLDKTV